MTLLMNIDLHLEPETMHILQINAYLDYKSVYIFLFSMNTVLICRMNWRKC